MTPSRAERERTLERVRAVCLGFPETSERLSHGAPTFVRGLEWDAIAGVLEDAYAAVAPASLVRLAAERRPA